MKHINYMLPKSRAMLFLGDFKLNHSWVLRMGENLVERAALFVICSVASALIVLPEALHFVVPRRVSTVLLATTSYDMRQQCLVSLEELNLLRLALISAVAAATTGAVG